MRYGPDGWSSESAISARISAARNAVGDDGKSQGHHSYHSTTRLSVCCKITISDTRRTPFETKKLVDKKIRYATADDGVKDRLCIVWKWSTLDPDRASPDASGTGLGRAD